MLVTIAFLQLLTLPPGEASRAGAVMAGRADLAKELLSICRREAGKECAAAVGLHPQTPGPVLSMYRKAVEKGWLGTCAHNTASDGDDRLRFGVRGIHGLSAAYSLWHLGPCVAPEALDIPFLSAVAAARRATYQCEHPRLKACTRAARRRLWVGQGTFDRQARAGKRDGASPRHPS